MKSTCCCSPTPRCGDVSYPEWPLELQHGDVGLRPLRLRDRAAWTSVRARNREWLGPWESTNPEGGPFRPSYFQHWRNLRRDARQGRSLPMAITYQGRFVGQLTLGNIVWGSLRQGYIGYWIDSAVAGRGIMPTAVALMTDYALVEAGLHRIEINIRTENKPSIRVVEKLGFIYEGRRPRYLHIDGDWRDHEVFVMTSEQLPRGGMLKSQPEIH
jgi:ribosomal-protein-alanine N-acetyltransferase